MPQVIPETQKERPVHKAFQIEQHAARYAINLEAEYWEKGIGHLLTKCVTELPPPPLAAARCPNPARFSSLPQILFQTCDNE